MEIISHATGMQFRFAEDPNIKFLRPKTGDEVGLMPEPDNKYDPNAIAVYFGTYKLGYIKAKPENFEFPENQFYGEAIKNGKIESCTILYVLHKIKNEEAEQHLGFDPSDPSAELDHNEFCSKGSFINSRGLGELCSVVLKTVVKEYDGPKPQRYDNDDPSITELLENLPIGRESMDYLDQWKFKQLIVRHDELREKEDFDIEDMVYIIENGYNIYRQNLDKTATNGTNLHDLVEKRLLQHQKAKNGESVDPIDVPEDMIVYDAGIRNFISDFDPTVLKLETKVYDGKLRLNGRFDSLLGIKGLKIIVDVKSGSLRRKHELQSSFYGVQEDADESWVVSFKTDNKCGYTIKKRNKEEMKKDYEVVKLLRKLCDLLGIFK